MLPDDSFFLGRSLATECTTVVISSAGDESRSMPVDLSGMYYDVGMTLENRPVFFSTNDTATSESVMYWTGGVSIAVEGEPDFSRQRHLTNYAQPRGDGVVNDGDTLALSGRGHRGSVVAREEGRALAACDSGGWILRESDGGYPAYMVFDCAYHPVDISSGVWYRIPSRGDSAETMDASFAVVCLDPEGNGGPSPASSDMTNSPAVEIVGFPTVSPGATVEVEDVFDRGSSSSPGVDDPLGWLASTVGASSSSRGSLTSSEGSVLGQDNVEGDDSGVLAGLLISGGIFVAVVAGAAIILNIVRRRKQAQSPSRRVATPSTKATNVVSNASAGGGEEKAAHVQGTVEDAVAIDIDTTADEKTEDVLDRPEGGHGLDVDPKRWLPEQPQDDGQPPSVVAHKKTEE
ncbi:unnamed protein product [Ectocarpus sp. CCAP 1310/34]|nr:unnamed protein product [Ectocarpus sp. CCAP 1310/34]